MVGLACDRGVPTVYVPAVDAAEASLVAGVEVIPTATRTERVEIPWGEVAWTQAAW